MAEQRCGVWMRKDTIQSKSYLKIESNGNCENSPNKKGQAADPGNCFGLGGFSLLPTTTD
jgi:hypothetical protein